MEVDAVWKGNGKRGNDKGEKGEGNNKDKGGGGGG